MDPVSNVDRLMGLLRQRLIERARTNTPKAGQQKQANDKPAVTSIRALSGVEDLDDRQLKRALVQNILVDQLGATMLNEPKFQQVVDQVTDAIDQDPQSSKLFGRIVEELRDSAR